METIAAGPVKAYLAGEAGMRGLADWDTAPGEMTVGGGRFRFKVTGAPGDARVARWIEAALDQPGIADRILANEHFDLLDIPLAELDAWWPKLSYGTQFRLRLRPDDVVWHFNFYRRGSPLAMVLAFARGAPIRRAVKEARGEIVPTGDSAPLRFECRVCGEVFSDEIPAVDHVADFHADEFASPKDGVKS